MSHPPGKEGVLGIRKVLVNRMGIEEGHKTPYTMKSSQEIGNENSHGGWDTRGSYEG